MEVLWVQTAEYKPGMDRRSDLGAKSYVVRSSNMSGKNTNISVPLETCLDIIVSGHTMELHSPPHAMLS